MIDYSIVGSRAIVTDVDSSAFGLTCTVVAIITVDHNGDPSTVGVRIDSDIDPSWNGGIRHYGVHVRNLEIQK